MLSSRVKKVMSWLCCVPLCFMAFASEVLGQTNNVDLIDEVHMVDPSLYRPAMGLYIEGGHLYVNNIIAEIFRLDISTPSSPSDARQMWLNARQASDMAFQNNTMYVAVGGDLMIYDITDFENASLIYDSSSNHLLPKVYGLYLQGNYLVAAAILSNADIDHPYLAVIDITDPVNPEIVNKVDAPLGKLNYINVGSIGLLKGNGKYLVMKSNYEGMRIYDATALPELHELYHFSDIMASDVVFIGEKMVVGLYEYQNEPNLKGIRIYDISDPASPVLQGSYDTDTSIYSLESDGSLVYAAGGEGGLLVFDVSDPTSPTFVGQHETPDLATDLLLYQGYAYVAVYAYGLEVFEYTGPKPANSATREGWLLYD